MTLPNNPGVSDHRALVHAVLAGNEPLRATLNRVTLASWQRCATEHGLDPAAAPDPVIIPRADLKGRQERYSRLLEIARPEMTNLYQQLAGSGHAIMLADRDGVVLNYIGDPIFTDTAARVGIQTGALWSEAIQGTNGMGTCLVEKQPLVIHQCSHFFERNAGLTCAAAPIFDPNGEVLAILNASSEATLAQHHTMVLLNMAAQVVENRVFFCAMGEAYIFRCHSRVEFIGTLGEGLIAFTPDGRVLAVNRSAIFQLELKGPEQIVGRFIHDLFTISLTTLVTRAHSQGGAAFPIHETCSERRFFAKIQPPEHSGRAAPAPVIRPHLVGEARSTPSVIGPFEALHFGDPRMERNVATIKKVLDRDIPCILFGETGVGKDVFARAIHQASPRRDKPFIALNCASLPESLIESELFGYKAGASGANREGSRGKVLQADGGTLFLDEIGDMPVQLQARLLRVLEDRMVVPLGGDKPIPAR